MSLEKQIAHLEQRNREIAQFGVSALADFENHPTPSTLERIQNELRGGLRWVEDRLRASERRSSHWRRVKGKRFNKIPDLVRRRGARLPLVRIRDELLNRQRDILRQLGDSCAWIVLGGNPRLLRLLFSQDRSHYLTQDGIGLIGPISIASAAHASGRFFVLENDLTRILGIGDITVVPYRRHWDRPLSLEIKTSGEFREGSEAHIALFCAPSNIPVDVELYESFRETLGLTVAEKVDIPSNAAGQVAELKERSDLMLRLTTRSMERLRRPNRSSWSVVDRVLKQAQQTGSAFETVEEGLVFASIRTRSEEDSQNLIRHLFDEIQRRGIAPAGRYAAEHSDQLRTEESVAPFVAPIPLWPVSHEVRRDLLAGNLVLMCFYDPEIWVRLLRAHGIKLEVENGCWNLCRGEKHGVLDPLEVSQIYVGLSFGGLIPSELTSAIADGL